MKITKKLFLIVLFAGSSWGIHSTEKTDITPDNSTHIYYEVAHQTYVQKIQEFDQLDPKHVVEEGINVASAKHRLYCAYFNNILCFGFHPGIPEKEWKVRGAIKWGNQQLLRGIVKIYGERYKENSEIKIFDPTKIDPVDAPFMQYGAGYTPQPYDAMDNELKTYIDQLKKEAEATSQECKTQ